MLCCIMDMWAGTGNGSKSYPYSGQWLAKDLAQTLKVGDYLAYDCGIIDGAYMAKDNDTGEDIHANRVIYAYTYRRQRSL